MYMNKDIHANTGMIMLRTSSGFYVYSIKIILFVFSPWFDYYENLRYKWIPLYLAQAYL